MDAAQQCKTNQNYLATLTELFITLSLCRPRQQYSETLVQTMRQELSRRQTQTFEDVSKTTITMWNQSKLNEAAQFTAPKKNSLHVQRDGYWCQR